jgi:hypothetical protein
VGAVASLYWTVVRAIDLDPSAWVWLMLAPVFGVLGRFWWFSGDQELMRRDAVNETRAKGRAAGSTKSGEGADRRPTPVARST